MNFCRYDSKLFSWTSGGSTIYCFLLPGSKHLIFWRMIFSGRLIVTLLISLLYHYLPSRNSGCINDWHHLFLILLLSETFILSWNFNLRSDGLYWLGFYLPWIGLVSSICDWFSSNVDFFWLSFSCFILSLLVWLRLLCLISLMLMIPWLDLFQIHVGLFNLDLWIHFHCLFSVPLLEFLGT